jgi:PRC-barrel domain protein
MNTELWTYRQTVANKPLDVQGFDVEATDGTIGKIDEATYDVDASYIVVDTGPWIFGKKVVLPAGAVETIDLDARTIRVRLTKEQIKGSPEYDEATYRGEDYRERLGTYYGPII